MGEVIHDDAARHPLVTMIVDPHDVGVVEASHRLGFSLKAGLDRLLDHQRRVKDLDGALDLEGVVIDEEDRRHPAPADVPLDDVAPIGERRMAHEARVFDFVAGLSRFHERSPVSDAERLSRWLTLAPYSLSDPCEGIQTSSQTPPERQTCRCESLKLRHAFMGRKRLVHAPSGGFRDEASGRHHHLRASSPTYISETVFTWAP